MLRDNQFIQGRLQPRQGLVREIGQQPANAPFIDEEAQHDLPDIFQRPQRLNHLVGQIERLD